MTIVRLLGAVGTGARFGALPRLPFAGAPPPPPPPPDTTADGAWAAAAVPPVVIAAVGAWSAVPVTPADCGACSVAADRADDDDDDDVESDDVESDDVDPDDVDPLEPTFAFGPVDAFDAAEAFGPPRLPFDFLAPPVRWLPTLAL